MTEKKVVNQILDDLVNVKENLLTLSDDIWDSINHNNPEKLDEGVQFKKSFNTTFQNFTQVSEQLAVLICQFTGLKDEVKLSVGSESENARLIAELNKEEPHSITENFTYKRPFAFTLKGIAFTNMTTWKDIYVSFLKYVCSVDSAKFASLLTNEDFVSSRQNSEFSKDKKELRGPVLIENGIFAEVNHSAKHIAKNICKILSVYGYSEKDMVVYLRQDRNT